MQLLSPTTGERLRKSPWLTVGKIYTVLALSAEPGREVLLRLIGDDEGVPGLFPSELFETVDDRIPELWAVRLEDAGTVHLAPRAWLRDGFWEDYFNGDMAAHEAFDVARAIEERDTGSQA